MPIIRLSKTINALNCMMALNDAELNEVMTYQRLQIRIIEWCKTKEDGRNLGSSEEPKKPEPEKPRKEGE